VSFLLYILALILWERWYMGRPLSIAGPLRRWKLRRHARHALAVNPAQFDARVDLARDALGRRRFAAARDYLSPILLRADDIAEIQRLQGEALLGVGRFEEAAAAFSAALGLDRKETESRLGLARAFYALGKWPEARREIEAYRAVRPGDARGSWAEAAIRLSEGSAEGAIASLKELVSEQRLKPGYVKRRDRKWSVKARAALLLRRPPARAW
jgi:tetratricopeptide (TPR) repeat protein